MRRSIPLACAALFVVVSCNENLPNGPQTFVAQLRIAVPHDTLVVGDSNVAQAQALDASGNQIESLAFTWTSADSSTVGFASPGASDTSNGRTRRLIGQRTGRSGVTIALPDPRFVSSPATRMETVVVGGVRVLTAHDSTLSAINDTGVAVAAGLVRVNGALVPRGGEGVRWVHLGSHTAVADRQETRSATLPDRTGPTRSSRRRTFVWPARSAPTRWWRGCRRRSRSPSRPTYCARGVSAIRSLRTSRLPTVAATDSPAQRFGSYRWRPRIR